VAQFLHYEPCPRCVANGRDRRGDNLGRYSDGGGHCWSCGHHEFPKHFVRKEPKRVDENKAVLPADFERQVPAAGWKWLLQYGLPYTYWRPFAGYSARDERLILTHGSPTRFSIGRYLGNDEGERDDRGRWIRRPPRKWWLYGDGHGYVELLGGRHPGPIVLVEDIISNHKVAQVAPSLCLFGTNLHDVAVRMLIKERRPVALWLDADQYTLLLPKINRLQALLDAPVKMIVTRKDAKWYSTKEIDEIIRSA
jgi:hypothetical protein